MAHAGGRPPFFETPEEMESLVEEYIESGEILTVTGLALKLGFSDRASLYDYKKKPEFTHIVKRALTLVENGYEKRLAGTTPTGSIFALKNMGWHDTQDVNFRGEMKTAEVSLEELESHIAGDGTRE